MNFNNIQIINDKTTYTLTTILLLCLSIHTQAQNAFTTGAAVFSGQDQVETADIDGDGDQDIITISASGIIVYLNDGTGSFTTANNASVGLPVGTGSPTIFWNQPRFGVGNIIGNSAPDILITTQAFDATVGGFVAIAELYENDGSGNFTLVTGTPFNGVGKGRVGFADLDGNGHNDIIIIGGNFAGIADFVPLRLFWNDGAGNFTVGSISGDLDYTDGDIIFGDIDGDTDLDIFLGGGTSNSELFRNNGDLTFTSLQTFSSGSNHRASFLDVENDNDLDLLFANNTGDFLYLNNGTGVFTIDPNYNFAPTNNYSLATGDIDGDGDEDIYIKGLDVLNPAGGFYINDGSGTFFLDETINTPNDNSAYSLLTDISGDNQLDLISTGLSNLQINAFSGFGNAVDFDGVNTYTVPHLAAYNALPITFEFWVNTGDNTVGLFDKRGGNGTNYIEIRLLSGLLSFNYTGSSAGSIDFTSTNVINDGQWHHCAVTINTTEAKMYIDGVLDKTVSWTGTASAISNTLNVTLGDFLGNKYTGILEEFRIWNTVRTQPEIANNMCSKITNPASNANLIAYFSFDEYVSGTTFFDQSNNYNHMTISASAITTATEQTSCTPATPLPVELTYFKGQSIAEGNLLTWQTAAEINNQGFSIEKSTDGQDWETTSFVNGNGTTIEMSNYEFTDNQPSNGINYYRLKQIDYDGNFEYSNIVNIEYRISNIEYRIFPNPATDYITIETNEPLTIQIINAQGQVIQEHHTENGQQVNIQDLPKGIYYVSLMSSTGYTTEKIIKK